MTLSLCGSFLAITHTHKEKDGDECYFLVLASLPAVGDELQSCVSNDIRLRFRSSAVVVTVVIVCVTKLNEFSTKVLYMFRLPLSPTPSAAATTH